MDLKGMQSVFAFAEEIGKLGKLFNQRENSFAVDLYKETVARNYVGAYYSLEGIANIPLSYFWLGAYFGERSVICLSFDSHENWADSICALFPKGSEGGIQGRTFSRPYYENNQLWFEFSKEQAKLFDELSNPDEQLEVIYEFVAEIIELIIQKAQS